MSSTYKINVDSNINILLFTTSNKSVITANATLQNSSKQNVSFTDRTYLYESNAFTFGVDTVGQADYTNGAFKVDVADNGNNPYLVYAIDCLLFAPYNSTQNWYDPYNSWYADPTDKYGESSGWTTTGDYVGPAITNSFSSNSTTSSTYVTPSVFYINPGVPSNATPTADYKVPVYSFIGSPYQSSVVTCPNGGCANQGTTLPSRLNQATRDWILYYQMNSSCSYNPLIGNMGFPFYYSTTSNSFMYFQIIFALPMYGGQYITNKIIANQGVNAKSPTAPGYLLAFYRRSYPLTSTSPYKPTTEEPKSYLKYSPYTKSTDKYPFGNFFPVIYEANNQANQNTGKLPYDCSLLYLLNIIYNTAGIGKDVSEQSFQTVHDALAGLEWLENLTNSSENKSSGVDFGTVQTLDGSKVELGSEWYFAGYVPHNFGYQGSSQSWSASVKEVPTMLSTENHLNYSPQTYNLTTTSSYGTTTATTPFMGNNIVMATTVPTDSNGNIYQYYAADKVGSPQPNYFWQSVATNCAPLSVLYSAGNAFVIFVNVGGNCNDGIYDACGTYNVLSTSCQIYQDPCPYIQTSRGDRQGSDYIIITKYFQPNMCSSKVFYPIVVFNVNFTNENGNYSTTENVKLTYCNDIFLYNYTNQTIQMQCATYHQNTYYRTESCNVSPGKSGHFTAYDTGRAKGSDKSGYYRNAGCS